MYIYLKSGCRRLTLRRCCCDSSSKVGRSAAQRAELARPHSGR